MGPPRVFISYSHDSREHCDRVLALAQQLRRDGIDAELDQFHQDELLHWPRWCEEQLRPENSDFVLCVCTEEYKHRVEGRVLADVGKGVFWEGTLIYNYLYDEKSNQRFVPILLSKASGGNIPSLLSGYTRFSVDKFGLDEVQSEYFKMYRLLTRQHGAEKADLGEILRLPPLPQAERRTDFTQLIDEIRDNTRKILSILENRTPPSSTPGRPHNLPPWMAPEYFIGRGKELRALCDGLAAQGGGALAVVQPQVVRGGGGIGKTRLAVQAVWVLYLQGKCAMAFYVSASSPSELDMQVAALSEKSLLGLYEGGEAPRELETRRQDVIHALREHAGRWILLIDAADTEAARDTTNKLLKELAGGRFVITSQRDDWPTGSVRKLPLDVFTPEEARACLRSRYWRTEPSAQEIADFDRVADELGYLPLALALAASYMDSRRIAPTRYLEVWKEKHDKLLGFSAEDLDYDRSLLAAFQLSYSQLDAPTAALLGLLAWLAPEPFPRRLVEDSERVQALLLATVGGSERPDATDALAQLRTLSLIQLDEESLRLHKLVLECARAVLPEQTRRESNAAALTWLTASLPDTEFDEAGWKLWSRLAPHLDAMVETGGLFHVKEETLAGLCSQYGTWLYYQARHRAAEPLMRRALAIDENSFGPEHPNVAICLNNLASLLQDTNRLAEAEPLMRRALSIDEKSFGLEHPRVAIDLNNLAQLLQDTNRLVEAEPLMRRALAIDEKSFGPEHPDVAIDLSNLAQLLQDTNRLAEAEPLMRRALSIDEKSFGPEHPDVAIRLNNLATLLQATNRLAEAEPLMRQHLVIFLKFTRATGHFHPHLRDAFGNYMGLLTEMSLAEEKVRQRLVELGKESGFEEESYRQVLRDVFK